MKLEGVSFGIKGDCFRLLQESGGEPALKYKGIEEILKGDSSEIPGDRL